MFLNLFSGLDTFKHIKPNHLPAKELQIQHNYDPNFWTKAKILLCKSYFSLSQIIIAIHTQHLLCKYSQISENFTPLVSDSKWEPASHTVGLEARHVNYLIDLNSPVHLGYHTQPLQRGLQLRPVMGSPLQDVWTPHPLLETLFALVSFLTSYTQNLPTPLGW